MSENKVEKIVYFVRHGQSEDNVSPVFQSADSPLSEAGRAQAVKIAQRTMHLSFAALLSSPYPRARETAEKIGALTGKTPEFSTLFTERVKPASVDGKPFTDEIAEKIWRAWDASLYTTGVKIEDGENYNDIISRADEALEFLKERKEESLLVVTHGYFLRAVVARVVLGEALSPESFKQFQKVMSMENTGLTVLRYGGAYEEVPAWRLWIYNDHAHLAD